VRRGVSGMSPITLPIDAVDHHHVVLRETKRLSRARLGRR